MLELNLGFRSVTYLIICFTSLVQNIGICSCYEHRIYVAYENTKTSNIHDSSDIDRLSVNDNVAVKWTRGDISISEHNGLLTLLLPYRYWPEETLDRFSLPASRSDLTRIYNPYVNSLDRFSLPASRSDLTRSYNPYVNSLDRFSLLASRSDLTRSYNPYVNSLDRFSSPASRSNLTRRFHCDFVFLTTAEFGLSSAYFGPSDTYGGSSTVKNETNPPLKTCSGEGVPLYINTKWLNFTEPGLSDGAIVGITIGVIAVVLLLVRCLYNGVYRTRNAEISSALLKDAHVLIPAQGTGSESSDGGLEGITVDKAVEFSYEELSIATNDFHLDNKIDQGGFGSVFYAELRAKKAAIKKMDMRASKEFLAELNVLTRIHHLNLVRLIGYCFEGSYFVVYEYIENGNLSQHLHGAGRDPLPWHIRVQIALDSARGLEYIHEYTVPAFTHCDIKSANILIDNNFNGKVADFGSTRLTEVGSRSRLAGTFGYMPPEYAQYGEVSPKVDVYAFGVVLYELISAKKAIIRANGTDGEPKGLIALFDEVLSKANPKEELVKMVDLRLGDDYPLDSVYKLAQLAKACTNVDPQRRPSMRSVVVALMTLSSSA